MSKLNVQATHWVGCQAWIRTESGYASFFRKTLLIKKGFPKEAFLVTPRERVKLD